jgi:hypothetical protein
MTTIFDEYTKPQADDIHQALIEAHLKPEADWPRLLADITMVVSDVCEGHSHPDTVLYEGDKQRRLQTILTGLEAAAKAYDQSDDRLQAHIQGQKQIPERCHDCGSLQWQDWVALVFEQTGTALSALPIQTDDQPEHRPYALGRLLDHALAAVRLALERPIDPMIAYMQKQGPPKNHAMRLIISELLEIFKRATGIEPTVYAHSVYASPYKNKKSHDVPKTNAEYRGTFYPFAVACLTPVFPAQELSSAILAAYKECKPTPMKQASTPPTLRVK